VAGSDGVTLTFRVLVTPSQVEVVRILVPNSQALELAALIAYQATHPPTWSQEHLKNG
jgi:hypothetical protein